VSASISSVLALPMNSFTAIFLDLLANNELHSDLLRIGGLVLDGLEGGKGGVSSVLLFHVKLLSPVPVSDTFTAIFLDSA
jgi:hypothetical protein